MAASSSPAIACVALAAALVAPLVAPLVAAPAAATEGGFVPGPVGGADIRAALVPPPGSYLLLFPSRSEAVDFRDAQGGRSPLAPEGAATGLGFGYARVFEGEVAGGRVGAAVMSTVGRLCLRLAGIGSQCQVGPGDTFMELFWSRPVGELGLPGPAADDPRRAYIPYGLTVAAGLGAVLPTGVYSRRDIAPIGLNTPVLLPNLALTWTGPPILADGTEVSARLFYAVHGRNRDTGYQAGDMLVLDWALSERVGRFQLGPTGAFARQLEPDRLAGQRGPSTTVVSLGATVAMDLPEWGMFLQLKYLRDVEAEWRIRLDRVGLRIGVRL